MKRKNVFLAVFVALTVIFVSFALTACNKTPSSSSSEDTQSETESSISHESDGISYTLAFDTNGGTRMFTRTVLSGSLVEILDYEMPIKTGYNFVGWYTDEALTTEWDGYMPTSNLTVYAKWATSTVDIYLYYNSPDFTDGVLENQYYNTALTLPTPTRPNATFAGWYFEKEYITEFSLTVVPAASTSAHARWEFNSGTTIYAASNGTPQGLGTESSPLDVQSALYFAGPGVTIECKTETYTFTTTQRIITVASGEFGNGVELHGNGSTFYYNMSFGDSNRGILMCADYWHIKDLSIVHAGDNGMLLGGNYNVIENCVFTQNRDTGLQIARYSSTEQPTIDTWPSNNIIKNCTSFDNYDTDNGEDADGFAAKLTVGYGNVFDGCISYNNIDDGWDLYAKSDTGPIGTVLLINCVAFNNGQLTNGTYTENSDGNGYKLGGSNISGQVIVTNCVAFGNKLHGFTDNSNPGSIIINNCTAFNNGVVGTAKDNFNLARNTSKSNNYYYGLLSYSTSNSYSAINGDDFAGSIGYSVVRICLDKSNTYTYAIEDYIQGRSDNVNSIGTKYTAGFTGASSSPFASITFNNPSAGQNLHSNLRNSDGSVNLGDFLKVSDPEMLSFAEGNQVGANLSLATDESYEHYTQPDLTGLTTVHDKMLKIAYDSLYAPCNVDAAYLDLNLTSSIKGMSITWASNSATINTNDSNYPGKGVLNRGNDDEIVTLTATITYDDGAGGVYTLDKSFAINVMHYTPGIGEIETTGQTQTYLVGETTVEPMFTVYDRNSKINAILELTTDYTIDITFKDASNNVVEDVTAASGTYTAYVSISLVHFDEEVIYTYEITVISTTAKLLIKTATSKYIVDNVATINASFSYKAGDLYVVAVPVGSTAPTQAEVIAMANYGAVTLIASQQYTINDFEKSFDLTVPSGTQSCDLYVVATNANGGNNPTKISNVQAMINISTPEEFIAMASASTAKAYAIVNDIDCTGYTLTTAQTAVFSGLLDGYGHTISNLTITGTGLAGVFANIDEGTVQNINFHNCTSTQTEMVATKGVGILAGFINGGIIQNVKLTDCSVTGAEGVGGLVGTANSGSSYFKQISIKNGSSAQIKSVGGNNRYIGGVLGGILGDKGNAKVYMNDIYVYASVGADTNQYVGGIVGRYKNLFDGVAGSDTLEITNAYYRGTITAQKYCGGMIGGMDKEKAFAYITNSAVHITIAIEQTENRSVQGRTIGDDYVIENNVFTIDFSDATKNNAEYDVTSYQVNNATFWVNNGFDLENIWTYDSTNGITLQ